MLLLLACVAHDPPMRPGWAIPLAPPRAERLMDEIEVERALGGVVEVLGAEGSRPAWSSEARLPSTAGPLLRAPRPPEAIRSRDAEALAALLGLPAGVLPTDADGYAGWMMGADVGALLRAHLLGEGIGYTRDPVRMARWLAALEAAALRSLAERAQIPPAWVDGHAAAARRLRAALPAVPSEQHAAIAALDIVGTTVVPEELRSVMALRAAFAVEAMESPKDYIALIVEESNALEAARPADLAATLAEGVDGIVGPADAALYRALGPRLEEGEAWLVTGTCESRRVDFWVEENHVLVVAPLPAPVRRPSAEAWAARTTLERVAAGRPALVLDADGVAWVVERVPKPESGGWGSFPGVLVQKACEHGAYAQDLGGILHQLPETP